MEIQGAEAIGASTRALASFSLGELTVQEAQQRITELAVEAAGADLAALTLLSDGEPRTTVFTDDDAPEIDAAQYRSGRGPCLHAYRIGEIVPVDDIATDGRWPEFAEEALKHKVASSLSLPLIVKDVGVGALNLYSRQHAAFANADMAALQVFAELSAVVIANVETYWGARNAADQMEEAMRSRATIEQAKGILIAGGAKDADEAFAMLVSASQRENRKLRDVAADIVDRAAQRAAEPSTQTASST